MAATRRSDMSDGTRAAHVFLRREVSGTPVETPKLGLAGRRGPRRGLAEGGGSSPPGGSSSLTALALLGLLDLLEEDE